MTWLTKQHVAPALLLLIAGSACGCHPRETPRQLAQHRIHVDAARHLTDLYSKSRLSAWNVRASAAGAECDVLHIDVSIVMEDTMVEALHYGAGAYEVYGGGVQHFSRDQAFRAVAYEDCSRRIWTYGPLSPTEAESLAPCR